MQVKLLKMPTPFKFRFVEDADVVKDLVEKEYVKIASQIEAPGFRKGNVPRNVAESQKWFNRFQMYKGIFDIIYQNAIEQEKLEIIDAADFEVIGQFDDKSPLMIQATVYLKPKVLSFDVAKVKVKKTITDITDDMITEQITVIQKQQAKYLNVTDENYIAKEHDIFIIDYVGQIDGKEFKGGTAKLFKYVIGETHFINGFEQQLVNIKPGKTDIVKVTFPEGYQMSELRGKDAEFTVTVHKLESCEFKSIETIAFERGLSVDDFKGAIKDKLIIDFATIDEEKFSTNVLSTCINAAEIEPIPEKMIEWELANEWNKLLYRLGMTEEEYLKKDPNAKSNFINTRQKQALKSVELRVFLDHVCDTNNISITRDEIINYLKVQGERLHKSQKEMDEVLANFEKENNYKATENAVKQEKAILCLVEQVKNNG
jgi:trigger factor